MHTRTITCEGYLRDDGLWDIEASLVDRKPYRYTEPFRGPREVGSDVHHMRIRLTVDGEMLVHVIEVAMPSVPYAACVEAIPNFDALVGRRIDKSWRATVREALSGERGCTHARELLFPLATTAFQTVHGWRADDAQAKQPRSAADDAPAPSFVGGCIGWALDGPVVARFYPQLARPRRGG
jgi:hypothetical protein